MEELMIYYNKLKQLGNEIDKEFKETKEGWNPPEICERIFDFHEEFYPK